MNSFSKMKISICIPTYNRIEFLKQAVVSCLNQTHLPYEILVGDDSPLNETQDWINNMSNEALLKIRYFHHRPSLKQAHNVNYLFKAAEGELIVLLHDDDVLLPTALENLVTVFIKFPEVDIAFGKQYLISNNGVIDVVASEGLNKTFYRTDEYQGTKLTSLESGFLQQFPNDAYMIRSEIVKSVQYNDKANDACDFDFGLRLGIANYKMYFTNVYTANYRISNESVSNKNDFNGGITSFELVEALKVPDSSLNLKKKWLINKSPIAIVEAARLKDYRKASKLYFSKWHRGKILTLGGIKRLFIVAYVLIRQKYN
jgi:glycosyltransferase involved in cell wall biosynthesis